jgi:anti-sigma B factor antagonist
MTADGFSVHWVGSLAVITVPQEIDMINAAGLRDALSSLIAAGPAAVVVDMTQTGFCDSAGVATVMRARQQAASSGVRLRIAASGPVERVLRLLEADRLIDVHSSLAAALGEAMPGHPPGAAAAHGPVSGASPPEDATPPRGSGSST